jgi:hypothetical protein
MEAMRASVGTKMLHGTLRGRATIELKMDRADLLKTGTRGNNSDWKKLVRFLSLLGFEPKIVRVHITENPKVNPHGPGTKEKKLQ